MMKMSRRIGSDEVAICLLGVRDGQNSIKRRQANLPVWNETVREQESYLSGNCEATLFRVQLMLQ